MQIFDSIIENRTWIFLALLVVVSGHRYIQNNKEVRVLNVDLGDPFTNEMEWKEVDLYLNSISKRHLTNRSTRTLPPRVTFPAKHSDSSSPTTAPLR